MGKDPANDWPGLHTALVSDLLEPIEELAAADADAAGGWVRFLPDSATVGKIAAIRLRQGASDPVVGMWRDRGLYADRVFGRLSILA